jgi:hypothetical protein
MSSILSHQIEDVHHNTLNLIATKDVYKQMAALLKNLKESTESKMKQIWNKQSRSAKASDEITKKFDCLFVIITTVTRWNSFVGDIDRFRDFINNKKRDLKDIFAHFNVVHLSKIVDTLFKEIFHSCNCSYSAKIA